MTFASGRVRKKKETLQEDDFTRMIGAGGGFKIQEPGAEKERPKFLPKNTIQSLRDLKQ